MYKKILVPLDGSETSEAVLPHVSMLAELMHAQVILLRVVTTPIYEFSTVDFVPPLAPSETHPDLFAQADGYLQRVAFDKFPSTVQVIYQVSGGPIADAILDTASGIEADLIAMSTHGRGGIARMVLGSVADEMLRRSHVPVLLIRPHNE